MITVKPYGGLGNRIRVLHSVLSLKELPYSEIEIIWEQSRNFNCPIGELFVIPEGIEIDEQQKTSFHQLKKKILHRLRRQNLSRYNKILFDKEVIQMRNENYDFQKLLTYSSVYIETCQWFYTRDKRLIHFEPAPEIVNRSKRIIQGFNKHTVGIHIRRTDYKIAIKASPDDEFERIIREEIQKNNDVMFYLATDSRQTEQKFKSLFKGRMITFEGKERSRNSPEGIKDAFAEMLCLSETKKIYGSYQSSFSHLASLMNNIEYETVKIPDA